MKLFKRKKKKVNTSSNKDFELAEMYAHRGLHQKPEIPENSLPAFRRALDYGIASELDVHLLRDGTLVVFHDDDLERETGVKGSIEAYDLKSLRKLRLEGTDEVIPTFDEVLELYEDSGLPLLIELKVVAGNHKALAKAAAERLKDYKGSFVVQSFYPRALTAFRKEMPGVALGQLSKNYFNKSDGAIRRRLAVAGNILANGFAKPDFVSYKLKDRKSPRLSRRIEKKGLAKAAWTIRTPEAFEKALASGSIPIFEGFNPKESKEISEEDEK